MRRLASALALVGTLGVAAAAPSLDRTPAEREATRATMRRIFADIQVLLPLAASDEAFRAPGNQERIRSALDDLAGRADLLAGHARSDRVRFRHLGESLARDAREARRTWQQGHPEHAQFLIQQLTENCVACHAGLPSAQDSPVAKDFASEPALAELAPLERARVQLATRRFDEALATFEELLADPHVHPAELLSPLTDYLTVSLRVKGDFERPVPVLQRFARRSDLWRFLRMDVEHWTRSLPELAPRAAREPSVAEARALFEQARSEIRFPADRRGLVHYVVASSLLHRYVAAHDEPGPQLAEAYYLLGLIESRIGRTEWVAQAGVFLETSIRLAPGSPFAETAYATLEEETLLDYGDALGEPLPPEVAANLAELRGLIDAAAASAR